MIACQSRKGCRRREDRRRRSRSDGVDLRRPVRPGGARGRAGRRRSSRSSTRSTRTASRSSAATRSTSHACRRPPTRPRRRRSTSSSSSSSATTRRRRPSARGRSSARTPSSRRSRTAGETATCSRRVFPPEQVVVGVTYNSGLLLEPGRVMHPADQPTIVGPFARRRYTARGATRAGARASRARGDRRVAGPPGDLEEADPERRDAAAVGAHRDDRGRADSP